MLWWAAIFLVVAIVAGIFGFGVVAGTAAWIAKILFILFIILLIASLFMNWRGHRDMV